MFKYSLLAILLLGLAASLGCGPGATDGEMFAQANQFQVEGKYEEAISEYNKLIEKYSDSSYGPQAQFMIGFIYANELEDQEKATEAYEKFLKIYPDHEMAKDANWELEHLGQDINDIEELTQETEEDSEEE